MTLSIQTILTEAERLIDTYRPWAESIKTPPRGIRHSEMFFFFCAVSTMRPGSILESGRAQGQSTLLASLCFPDTPVISVEHNRDHPDAAIAAERLADRKNVTCLFGDARVELPARTQAGDVVLIDGPKDFRALKLAADLMRNNKPAAVFVHDCQSVTRVRHFLDRNAPWALFADDETFQARYGNLDGETKAERVGLAYLPPNQQFISASMGWRLTAARWTDNVLGSFAKRV